jgi:hypothetical protein
MFDSCVGDLQWGYWQERTVYNTVPDCIRALFRAVVPRLLHQVRYGVNLQGGVHETYLSSNHPYQYNPERPAVHLGTYMSPQEQFRSHAPLSWTRVQSFLDRPCNALTRSDHDGVLKATNANVSIYAKKDCRWPDVVVYDAGVVYKRNS